MKRCQDNLPTLYHMSPFVYDKVCMDAAKKHVIGTNKSPNGVLGLWLSAYPDACDGFGPVCYEVALKKDHREYQMPLSQLRKLFDESLANGANQEQAVQYHIKVRDTLLQMCDVVYVMERMDRVGEIIVVNLDIIETMKVVDQNYVTGSINKGKEFFYFGKGAEPW